MDDYQHTLKKANLLKKKPCQIIDMILKNELEKRDLSDPYLELFQIKTENKPFLSFIKIIIAKKGNPIIDKKYIKALYEMYKRKENWIRNISDWKRKSYNVDKQVKSIADHLFCRYDVPEFMYKSWYWENRTFHGAWVDWFIHIGQGGNIRTAEYLPVNLTKKMAHHFLLAPDKYTPAEALRWGQVHGFGGNEKLVRGIVESKIGKDFGNDDFWQTIIHFFVRNPMLDTAQVSPLIDYISYLKFEGDRVYDDGLRIIPPPQPNFEIKGRTVDALIRGMEKWHKEIGKNERKGTPKKWEGYDIPDFKLKVGKDKNLRIFKIQQLLTASELRKEGTTHGHCVGSYSRSCVTGRSSIWSMNVEDFLGLEKPLLTIELNRDRYINQVRGKGNRRPTAYELNIITKWADKEGLTISKWI